MYEMHDSDVLSNSSIRPPDVVSAGTRSANGLLDSRYVDAPSAPGLSCDARQLFLFSLIFFSPLPDLPVILITRNFSSTSDEVSRVAILFVAHAIDKRRQYGATFIFLWRQQKNNIEGREVSAFVCSSGFANPRFIRMTNRLVTETYALLFTDGYFMDSRFYLGLFYFFYFNFCHRRSIRRKIFLRA